MIYLYRVGEYDDELLEVETRRLKEPQREALKRYHELKSEQVRISQLAEQMESIETYCEWATQNLENLYFGQKRLVLEALEIQVVVDGKQVMIRGFSPIGKPALFPAFPAPGNPIGPINPTTNSGERGNRTPWLSEPWPTSG